MALLTKKVSEILQRVAGGRATFEIISGGPLQTIGKEVQGVGLACNNLRFHTFAERAALSLQGRNSSYAVPKMLKL